MNQNEFKVEIYIAKMRAVVAKLKELRLKNGYSRQDIADMTGLNIKTIYRVENLRNFPREKTLSRMAECYSLAVEDLFDLRSDYLHIKKCYNKDGRRYFMYI